MFDRNVFDRLLPRRLYHVLNVGVVCSAQNCYKFGFVIENTNDIKMVEFTGDKNGPHSLGMGAVLRIGSGIVI